MGGLKITVDDSGPRIEFDGEPIRYITDAVIELHGHEPAKATLTLVKPHVAIEADFVANLTRTQARWWKRLLKQWEAEHGPEVG